jgi:hypothetical protein
MLFWLPVVRCGVLPRRLDGRSSRICSWPHAVRILSAFLVFSERVAPIYLSMPRLSGLGSEDQQLAGALMWTVVTIVYLTAGVILSARLLSPQGDARPAVEGI